MSRGFVILAVDAGGTDYVKCARALAKSIRKTMPNESITLITDAVCDDKLFDHILPLPYGDLAPKSKWKLINDWQVYEASPYEYTIKLEADMIIPRSIEYWWDVLHHRDLVVSSTIRNYKGEISDSRFYRRFIDDNKLPDAYNAITYFKKSDVAKRFFDVVRDVFEHWVDYRAILKCKPQEEVTTDWAYAIACHIMGTEYTMMPMFTDMSMVHMKQFINGLPHEDWTKIVITETIPVLRLNSYVQNHPFHYHLKSFADIMDKTHG